MMVTMKTPLGEATRKISLPHEFMTTSQDRGEGREAVECHKYFGILPSTNHLTSNKFRFIILHIFLLSTSMF